MSEEPKAEKPKKIFSIIEIISQLSIVMVYNSREAFGNTEVCSHGSTDILLAVPKRLTSSCKCDSDSVWTCEKGVLKTLFSLLLNCFQYSRKYNSYFREENACKIFLEGRAESQWNRFLVEEMSLAPVRQCSPVVSTRWFDKILKHLRLRLTTQLLFVFKVAYYMHSYQYRQFIPLQFRHLSIFGEPLVHRLVKEV